MASLHIDRRELFWGLAASAVWCFSPIGIRTAEAARGFSGTVIAEWLADGRRMKLVKQFEYVSADGRKWPVPAGAVIDGASIPEVFWSVVGGPFEGPYRGPSVIHDFYCETRTRSSGDVHKVFHEAMLTSGVGKRRAWLMYQAVLRFGPSWADPRIDPRCEVAEESYDFEFCARNSAKPPLIRPKLGEAELSQFIEDMDETADPKDLARLRNR